MRVEGTVIHLTSTLGFIDVRGKAVQFARDAAPNIRLQVWRNTLAHNVFSENAGSQCRDYLEQTKNQSHFVCGTG